MTIHRITPRELEAAAVDAAIVALESVRIVVGETRPPEDGSFDAVLDVMVDDRPFTVTVEGTAYCTGRRAEELIARHGPLRTGLSPLVVSDKITTEARTLLTDAGWSWLDRRGRLHLRGPAVRVDLDLPRHDSGAAASPQAAAIAGRGGITVAYALCAHPEESLSPTRSAPRLRLAPSTISVAVRRLADAGLVDDNGSAVLPELFWELASVWHAPRTWLATVPDPQSLSGAGVHDAAWRRTGTAAAAAHGAPVVSTEGGPIELYVPGPVVISIAVRRYGAAQAGIGAAALAVAPVTAVTDVEDIDLAQDVGGWPSAPLLAVALDLAQDRARGRTILSEWSPTGAVWT